MRSDQFKAPYIPRDRIWQEADQFLAKYWPDRQLPVDILAIAEFDLGLVFEPKTGMKQVADVDALLLRDLRTIQVDRDDFLEERAQNRFRYSVAHEIGHLILHPGIIRELAFESVEEWIETMQALPDDQYSWLEQHAYEFAGRVLVPHDHLVEAFRGAVSRAEESGFANWDSSGEAVLEYVSQSLCRPFRVSAQVIQRRLVREGLWPPAKGDAKGSGRP